MKIDISHLAKLANVKLTKEQEKILSESIPTVIAYMDQIKNLDLAKIPETSRVTEEINILREDEIEPSLTQKEALSNAKKTHNGFFVVPFVFEKEEK